MHVRNHFSHKCDIITKLEVRKEILIRENRCFICIKTGHSAYKCRSTWKCRKWEGKHNTSICCHENRDIQINKPDKNENKTNEKQPEEPPCTNNCFLHQMNSVLLQTARGKVSSLINEIVKIYSYFLIAVVRNLTSVMKQGDA